MANKQPGQVPSKALQPEPKIIENKPASSVSEALKNAQAQVDKAKGK
jgi:hypothetical protein